LIMNAGAEISNTASESGGLHIVDGAFTMNDGDISGNKAFAHGGGVSVSGANTIFTMNDGNISGNKAIANGGGVYIAGGTFKMTGGKITGKNAGHNGGGVFITGSSSRFFMDAGTIGGNIPGEGNEATDKGGGVYVDGGAEFSMDLSAKIIHNTVTSDGGGVYVSGESTFTMERGGTISDNTADSGNGGGVYVSGNNATFTMKSGGTIRGNKVLNENKCGGGVYVGAASKFIMTRGTISGNAINPQDNPYADDYGEVKLPPDNSYGKGIGVYVSNGGSFTKEGGVIYGLVKSDLSNWEETLLQNYYKWTESEQPDGEDLDWEKRAPGGKDRGYAVYYDGEGAQIRNETVYGDIELPIKED
jgi:hypothetical protein